MSTRMVSPAPTPGSGRKRARVDEEPEIEELLQMSPQYRESSKPSPPHFEGIVRDDTYYLEDGSLVLQVENTLFNIHRTTLSKDSSMFSTMFELPQAGNDLDGASDANPLLLHGDTVDEFRNFLWALYALPHELLLVHTPKAELNRLMDIARISFKYQLKSVETWALDAITDHVNRKDSPICAALGCTPSSMFNSNVAKVSYSVAGSQVARLVKLAHLCGHDRLVETMVSLLSRLMNVSLLYAHLAMTLADELELRALRGIAYFEVMQKPVVVRDSSDRYSPPPTGDRGGYVAPEEDILDNNGRLIVTREQQLRILTGYYRLSTAWEQLRLTPLPFDHAATCGATWHQHGCTQSWLDFWKEKTKGDSVMAMGLGDYLGRLRAIVKEFDRWGSATYLHHDCRMIARRALLSKIKDVDES
ncbi:hypothetical protein EIP91_004640 [Steccherinum ochraceum]|uniref:BTB domain-containing protein n=1 Tax=Steccherinum ochraceum TaxID=92696 RepID=A0A4R0RN08_9APHY|nr:hypothetical protein EIP91_004640 [Steccherinum ochraceum]